jgi:pimeloyl-ACP methyl ester carboxylesterase
VLDRIARGEPLALALLALAILAALALGGVLHLLYWTRRLRHPLDYAETRRLITPDGAAIELRRVPIPVGVERHATLPPILLVHGVAANHRNQDLTHDESLARHLAALGRDVWLVTLRSGRRPESRADARKKRFSAMVAGDLPCAIDAVLAETGAAALDYVGFSMGGMLLYAAFGRTVAKAKIRRVVFVGSPGKIIPALPIPRALRFLPRALVPTLPLRLGARAFAFMSEWFSTPLHALVVNPRNVGDGVTRLALVNVIEDMPAALNDEFLRWSTSGGEIVLDGAPVLAGLAEVEAPALFLAGSADRMAPREAVHHAYEAWARARPEVEKRFVVLGRDYDSKHDYGHGDLAVGAHVGVEIFPLVARFLGPEQSLPAGEPAPPAAEEGAAAVADVERRESVG